MEPVEVPLAVTEEVPFPVSVQSPLFHKLFGFSDKTTRLAISAAAAFAVFIPTPGINAYALMIDKTHISETSFLKFILMPPYLICF